jgi:predicted nucleic acid-binding protein
MRVVIDTNVIIDAFASREPWNVDAENIIMLASEEKLEAVLCASAVTDIYYICNKIFHDKVKTRQVIKALFSIFTVTDVRKKDLQDALNLDMDDFEDAVISVCAKRADCQYIVTRNNDDYSNSPVPAITPKKFIASFDK